MSQKIVRAELHLDESTSHIHVYLVPLEERGIKGSRAKLLTSENQKLRHSTTANRKENQDSEYREKYEVGKCLKVKVKVDLGEIQILLNTALSI